MTVERLLTTGQCYIQRDSSDEAGQCYNATIETRPDSVADSQEQADRCYKGYLLVFSAPEVRFAWFLVR